MGAGSCDPVDCESTYQLKRRVKQVIQLLLGTVMHIYLVRLIYNRVDIKAIDYNGYSTLILMKCPITRPSPRHQLIGQNDGYGSVRHLYGPIRAP